MDTSKKNSIKINTEINTKNNTENSINISEETSEENVKEISRLSKESLVAASVFAADKEISIENSKESLVAASAFAAAAAADKENSKEKNSIENNKEKNSRLRLSKDSAFAVDKENNIKNSFDTLNLNKDLIKGIYLYGFNQPSSIQIKGIHSINTGKDCIIQSQSGTGKTATYLLGVINRLEEENTYCQGLIITPTRELTTQVYDVAINLSKFTKFNIVKCTGGTDINQSKIELRTAKLVIGTLGRIYHMIYEKKLNIFNLKFIVLDEADELLSEGITDKLHFVFDKAPCGVQVILISATMSINVFNTIKKFIHEPIKILLKNNEIAVELISQFYLDIETEEYKFDTLLDLYNLISTSQTIIFCNTIRKVEWLEQNLKENNFPITVIHSNMTQQERDNIVKEFRDGKTRLLLTTDLLSRGIDIPQVNMVINYDLPPNKETYIHRIGRCGRFDKKGVAITMIKMSDPVDVKTFNKMKHFYKINITEMPENINDYL